MTDQLSFKTLFNANADDLLRISYAYVKDWHVAEDIVQEVFLTYWQKSEAFRGDSSLETYLTRFVINRSKDYLKSWQYRTHFFTNEFKETFKLKKRLIKQDEQATIGLAILNLPVEQREIIMLYFYKELNYREIAELLEISESAVRKRMDKAKNLLKDALKDEVWEVYLHVEAEA